MLNTALIRFFFLSFNLISAPRHFIMYSIYIRSDDRNISDKVVLHLKKKTYLDKQDGTCYLQDITFSPYEPNLFELFISYARSMLTRLYHPYKYYRTLRSESVSVIYEFIIVNIVITYAQAEAFIYCRKGFRLVMNRYNSIHRLLTDDNTYYTFVNAIILLIYHIAII